MFGGKRGPAGGVGEGAFTGARGGCGVASGVDVGPAGAGEGVRVCLWTTGVSV